MPLSFHNVANVFVTMRRHAKAAQDNHILTFESGSPVTDNALEGDTFTQSELPITRSEVYTCTGGVDSEKLLQGTRRAIFSSVAAVGANALVEEQWSCTICTSKKRVKDDETYIVYVGTPLLSAQIGRAHV